MLQTEIGPNEILDGVKIGKEYKFFKDSSKKICNVMWKNLKKLVMTQTDQQIKTIKVSC